MKPNKKGPTRNLRLFESDDEALMRLRDMTLMKDTDILTLIVHAGMQAIKPHFKKRLQVPFEFALLDEDGNTMATEEITAQNGRKIKHSRRDSNPQGLRKISLAPVLVNC